MKRTGLNIVNGVLVPYLVLEEVTAGTEILGAVQITVKIMCTKQSGPYQTANLNRVLIKLQTSIGSLSNCKPSLSANLIADNEIRIHATTEVIKVIPLPYTYSK